METYKADLNLRYWQYQRTRFPDWEYFFDRPQGQNLRPPVFKVSEAWRNVIIKPDAGQHEKDHCDGTYTRQKMRVERCSLTEIGVLYWRYVPKLFHWNGERDIIPCPLYANYQLVRNIVAICARPGETQPSSAGHAVLVYDERNPAFQESGKGHRAYETTRQALIEPKMLRKCSWQQIMGALRTKRELAWLTDELKAKYDL